jgi:hypothetical protein
LERLRKIPLTPFTKGGMGKEVEIPGGSCHLWIGA